VIEPVDNLRNCTSEKGRKNSAVHNKWANGSVFSWIDENIDALLANADLVICDDGSNECCDFLVVGRRNDRDVVQMVHAKASNRERYVAAGALHEVCSQAAKHVGTPSLFGPQKPAQLRHWNGAWQGPSGEGRVDKRIRVARGTWRNLTAAEIWEKVSGLLQRHSTEREVILVLGALLDRKKLFDDAKKTNTPARAVQVLHLLRATMSSVVGGGARLRILCSGGPRRAKGKRGIRTTAAAL
jgi:hypothetical protein